MENGSGVVVMPYSKKQMRRFARLIYETGNEAASYREAFDRPHDSMTDCIRKANKIMEGVNFKKFYQSMVNGEIGGVTRKDRMTREECLELLSDVVREPQSVQLKAIERLSKMEGWDQPKEVNHNVSGIVVERVKAAPRELPIGSSGDVQEIEIEVLGESEEAPGN